MKLLIAGDLVPTKSNQYLFTQGNIKQLLGKELYEKWRESEYKLFNLETPICETFQKIKKTGPCLKADPSVIKGIKKLNPSVVGLANNHIMDYGENGCRRTLSLLNENNVPYVGIGKCSGNVEKFYVINDSNIKVGIYACCDTEFSGATKTNYGANLYDEFVTFDDISQLKEQCDKVVVLYHGGKEFYRYPSPRLQKLCRKLVDSGADIVVCQHSHCIGSVEQYNNSTIIYGQGNFIFDGGNDEYWNTGIILEVDFGSQTKINYILIKKEFEKIRMILPKEKEYEEIMSNFIHRSEKIKNEKFVIKNYEKFADNYLTYYLDKITRKTIFYRIINKIMKHKYSNFIYNENDYLQILNILQCSAHNELFICGLKNKIGMKNEDE